MSPFLDFIGAKDDGGDDDSWSYKTCKAPVKSLPSTPNIFTGRMPFLLPSQQRQSSEGSLRATQGDVLLNCKSVACVRDECLMDTDTAIVVLA